MHGYLYDWQQSCGRENALESAVPLKELTSFRVGGPAALAARPATAAEFSRLLQLMRQHAQPYALLGAGSNVVAADEGYPGLLILSTELRTLRIEGNRIYAGAGVHLSELSRAAMKRGLTGLEFASGIPGTLGGGLYMNAGAYGGELSQVVTRVTLLEEDGTVRVVRGSDMHFAYRHSLLQEKKLIALGAELTLQPGDSTEIAARMRELAARRREKQPIEYPSAGSFYKRPEGFFAGALIEQAGLKNTRVGGALISPKHAGFMINTGSATADEILTLSRYVQKRVKEESGVVLEPEPRYLSLEGFTELV